MDADTLAETTIAVFAKEADAGDVKTRLGRDIGYERAARLYECFLEDIAETVSAFGAEGERDVSHLLAFAGAEGADAFEPFRTREFELVEQADGGLGERLTKVARDCFERGTTRLIIIGTDSPTLQNRHFDDALAALDSGSEVVLGPSFDGGYYLVGLGGPHTVIFDDIDWSTPRVLEQTLQRAHSADLLCDLLEFWYDVDTLDDLKRLRTHLFEFLRYRHPEVAPETAAFIDGLTREVFE